MLPNYGNSYKISVTISEGYKFMVAIDWLVLVLNQNISKRDHFISNEYFATKKWLLIYNKEDENNSIFHKEICDMLFNVRITQYESLSCNWHDYFDILFKFNKWLNNKEFEKTTAFGISGVTNAISAVNAIRDTITRKGLTGFVFSFRKDLNNQAYSDPIFTPLNTNTLTDEHLEIVKALLKLNRKVDSQNELLEYLIRNVPKYNKYVNDENPGKRVLSYYIKQLEQMHIIEIEQSGRKKIIKLL
jgi:hypothetical protein